MLRNLLNSVWDRWANIHPFVRFIIVVAVLALGGFMFLKPGYHAFKSWRLDKNLNAAEQAVKETRMDEARDLSLTVLRAGDPRIEAFRILEKSTGSLRDPMHGDIARALMTHPEGSDEDRLNGFRGMAPEAPMGVLGQAWASLPETSRIKPEFAVVFGKRLIEGKRFSEAASVLLSVPEANRDAATNQSLVRVLLGSGKKDGFDEAQRWISAHWPRDRAETASWLDVLEQIPVISLRSDLLAPVRASLIQPGPDPARYALAIARLDYASNFPGRADLLKKSVDRWKGEAPVILAKFLSDLGLYGLLLETFPPGQIAEQPALFPFLLTAMENSGTWEEAKKLLDQHGSNLTKVEFFAHRSLIALKAGNSAASVEEWNSAMGEAKSGTTPNAYLTLARFAQQAGMEAEANQAMLEAVRSGRGPLPLYADLKGLLGFLASQGRENELLQICAVYLPFEPGNPVLLTQYAYLACLNNLADPKLILKAIKPLADAYKDVIPIQCVLATVYLSDGNPTAAAEALDRLKAQPEQLSPGYRAAFFATQVVTRKIPKDDPKITSFPWKSLLPSERRKFGDLIRSVKTEEEKAESK